MHRLFSLLFFSDSRAGEYLDRKALPGLIAGLKLEGGKRVVTVWIRDADSRSRRGRVLGQVIQLLFGTEDHRRDTPGRQLPDRTQRLLFRDASGCEYSLRWRLSVPQTH